MSRRVQIAAQLMDVTQFEADAVVVRHASGAAGAVAEALGLDGEVLRRALPAVGSVHVVPGKGRISSASAAFFRTVPPSSLNAAEVRLFSGEVLKALRTATPEARHLGMTLHGVLFGLRLPESLRAQLDGWTAALSAGEYPAGLERITIVAGSGEEVRQIGDVLRSALPDGSIAAASPAAESTRDGGLGSSSRFDAFISFKSEDAAYAATVYELLTSHGLRVFFSRESLPRLGSDEYHAQIDRAIEQARHMVVVTSSHRNVSSQWVEYEWRLFLGERLAGRKDGNLLTVLAAGMRIGDLPISLRNREAIRCEPDELARLLEYLRAPDAAAPAARADGAASPQGLAALDGLLVAVEYRRKDTSWDGARRSLETLSIGGRTGWRLPTLIELRRIRDARLIPWELCWWSSEEAGAQEARYMHFDDGHVGQGPKSYSNGVCAVLVHDARS